MRNALYLSISVLVATFCVGCADYCETYDGYYCELSRPPLIAALHPRQAARARRALRRAAITGDWQVTLKKSSGVCAYLPPGVKTSVVVQEQNGQLFISIPKLGRISGRKTKSGLVATGRYSRSLSSCVTDYALALTQIQSHSASVTAGVTVTCNSIRSCTLQYSGSAKR